MLYKFDSIEAKKKILFLSLIMFLILFRLGIVLFLLSKYSALSEEIEIQGIARKIPEGDFNFKYAFYPFFISPLVKLAGEKNSLYFTKLFSLILGIAFVFLSYYVTKNILFFLLLCFQPMGIYLSSLAKADIIILIFSLLSFFYFLRYDERGDRKYIFLSSFFASLCVVFKYYIPIHFALFIAMLVRERFKLSRDVLFSYIQGFFPLFIFLPFFIIEPSNFLRTLGEQGRVQFGFDILEGEKNIFSAFLALACGFGFFTPYSILFFSLILFSSLFYVEKKVLLYSIIFSSSMFFSMYFVSPHLFLHYYYPAVIPLSYVLTRSKYKVKFFLVYFILLIFSGFKEKDFNYQWIPKLENDCKGKKAVFFLPASHFFLLETKMIKCDVLDSLIYDIELGSEDEVREKVSSVLSACKKDCIVFFDVSYKKTQEILIEDELRKKGFKFIKKIDSFDFFELDRFERFLFPVFKNLLFHFIFRIYHYSL